MHKSKVVNTKRERRSSNNKNQNNNISRQPQTESYSTIGALVTGLTSTQANMSNDTSPADTLIIKPTSIEINNTSSGVIYENGNHSPSKSLKLKIGNENENEHETILPTNGYHNSQTNSNDHIYETPLNVDSNNCSTSLETPTISSSDEQGNKHIQNSHLSSTYSSNEHHLNNGLDSGSLSEVTNPSNNGIELENISLDDALNAANGISGSSIISAARLLEVNQPRELSPTSGVIIPEEKRVTDRVKVFEAVANNDQSTLKKQTIKNGNQKKTSASFSSSDQKPNSKREQQLSPSLSSTTDSVDNQLANELKSSSSSTTSKNKSKRPSLKKQIQNLLKIDKTPIQDDATIIEEHIAATNGKKSNTLNSTRNKRDTNDSTTPTTTVKRSSPPTSQQHSPTNGHDTYKKRSSPPLTTTTTTTTTTITKRTSPRESPSKSQQHSPISHAAEFNMKPIVEPLQISIDSNLTKTKTPSPSTKTFTNGLLTSETEQRRSSTGVSKLINTFQGSSSHELEQTVLVPRLRSPARSINNSDNSSSSPVVSQTELSTNLVSGTSSINNLVSPSVNTNTSVPSTSSIAVTTHSPMSSGVTDLARTTTRSVSIETGTRNRTNLREISPSMQRQGLNDTSSSSPYALLNQSTNAIVTDNLRVQHQREKQELSELNDRFRGYLDRVKILENKNAKLTGQLEDITKSWGAASQAIVAQYAGPLDNLRQEVNDSMIDEADLQTRLRRSHYTIDNYRSLINDETAWNDRQEEKREQLKLEYEHSCAELAALQKSYKQVEDQLKNLLQQREQYLNEIDQLNDQSYKATIDRIKLDLQVQTLREEIPFLNDVHAHLLNEFEQLKPTNGIDTQLFYRQELEKAIRDIRRDFETLHAAQRKEMEEYYNVKIEEIQNDAKKLLPLQSRQDELMKINEQIKAAKFDLNDSQKLLSAEKEKYKNLQDRLSKLEEEYGYVRDQRSDANDSINKDLALAQERIQQLTGEIDTVLRSNITLESEINVYRRLLDSETNRLANQTVEQTLPPEPAPPSFGSELGKVFNKKIKKGPIAIKDCAPDGKCITLENSSSDKDVDVSNWTLKRRVEGSPEISYTMPYGLIMKHNCELKIFARSAQNAHHRPPLEVVNDKLDSWGMGTECETRLFNEQGDERASHSQKIVFGSESSRNLPW
ncbi:unnamed protein product [Rotaria magnacalcarata]|uniref:Lamin n=2 Tax=Rotaria magnacalcarata TaxID=392030 RepID=A0A816YBB0_9BILA|nr:unnamed protein product [Rotaria magnacalcarata]